MNLEKAKTVLKAHVMGVKLAVSEGREPDHLVMYWEGPPGVGKSAGCAQVAKELDVPFQVITASCVDPTDMTGIPYRDGTDARYTTPALYPDFDTGIILINEMGLVTGMLQSSFWGLMQERRMGQVELPPGVIVVVDANGLDHQAGVRKMLSPTRNRIQRMEIEPDHLLWTRYAAARRLHPVVVATVLDNPDLICNFDPQSDEFAYSTARSLESASRVLRLDVSPELRHEMLLGTVGKQAANAIGVVLLLEDKLAPMSYYLDDPAGCDLPANDAQFLMIQRLASHCAGKRPMAPPFYALMERFKGHPEKAMVGVKSMMSIEEAMVNNGDVTEPIVTGTPEHVKWCEKYIDLVV